MSEKSTTEFPRWDSSEAELGITTYGPEPFAEGSMRWAFKGMNHENREKVVVKLMTDGSGMVKSGWLPDEAMQRRADLYAQKWNKEVSHRNLYIPARQIHFTKITYKTVIKTSGKYSRVGEYVSEEQYLEGKYVKFNSNGGYEDSNTSNVMTAFSHWTFEKTGHSFLVCDLQGVINPEAYWLTDPVIHSFDHRFSKAHVDMGQMGMEKVMAGHKCNFVCEALGLPKWAGDHRPSTKKESTLFSFQLTAEEKLKLPTFRSPLCKVVESSIPEEDEEEVEKKESLDGLVGAFHNLHH